MSSPFVFRLAVLLISLDHMKNYWTKIETQWYTKNRKEIQSLLNTCAKTHDLVAGVAQHSDFVSRPKSATVNVQRLLLRRLGEELRGVELLTINGHGFQAISAAANLFEQSHFLTYAASSETVAQTYLSWSKPAKSIESIIKVVEKSGGERGWDKSRIDEEYQTYRFLCGFKHNNAFMQRILHLPNPDLWLGQFALANSIWFILSTVGLLVITTLSPAATTQFITACNTLMDDVQPLFPILKESE